MLGFRKKLPVDGFPAKFRSQNVGIHEATVLSDLHPAEIAAYFLSHQEIAKALLSESYDKRYRPSTFIQEESSGYSVGWYSNGYECIQHHSDLANAATDYLLFSLGKCRWKAPEN